MNQKEMSDGSNELILFFYIYQGLHKNDNKKKTV